jgi:hypothetical protein
MAVKIKLRDGSLRINLLALVKLSCIAGLLGFLVTAAVLVDLRSLCIELLTWMQYNKEKGFFAFIGLYTLATGECPLLSRSRIAERLPPRSLALPVQNASRSVRNNYVTNYPTVAYCSADDAGTCVVDGRWGRVWPACGAPGSVDRRHQRGDVCFSSRPVCVQRALGALLSA